MRASIVTVLALLFPTHGYYIGSHHVFDQICEARLVAPAELTLSLGRIAQQEFDLSRPEIAGIDLNQNVSRLGINTTFLDAFAAPFDVTANLGERRLDKLAY